MVISRRGIRDVLLFLGSALAVFALLLALDVHEHQKSESGILGLNVNGYRGPVLGAKQPGEVRLEVLGGSPAFGYLLPTGDTMPAQLGMMLQQRLDKKVTVANLAFNGESSVCFPYLVSKYAYLQPDVVLIYAGLDDLSESPLQTPDDCARRHSAIFRLTGYLPVLPALAREKYYIVRYGSADVGYREDRAVPLLSTSASLGPEQQTSPSRPTQSSGCAAVSGPPTARDNAFINVVTSITASTLAAGRAVVVASEPQINQDSCDQQAALRQALMRFQSERFRYVDADVSLDMVDPRLSFDGMHLTSRGSLMAAQPLVEPLTDVVTAGRLAVQ